MSTTLAPCDSCGRFNRVQLGRAEAETPVCGHCQAMLPIDHGVSRVSGSTLQRLVSKADLLDTSVVADFWSPQCIPCRTFEREFQRAALQLATQTEGRSSFVKLNVQEHSIVASAYQIRTLPTIIIFRRGVETVRQFGALPYEVLIQWLSMNLLKQTGRAAA